MKRLSLALGLVLFLISAALLNAHSLTNLTNALTDILREAQYTAEAGSRSEALALTKQAEEKFLRYSAYLHSTLNHQTIDRIRSSFSEVSERLRWGESISAYAAANSSLLMQLQLLSEAEQFSLKNLL